MAAEVLKHPDYASLGTDDFFEVALEEGFTKQGEMFWAEDLSKLAELVLNCQSKVIYGNISDNWRTIVAHLMNGLSFLRNELFVYLNFKLELYFSS